jgi:polyphosphate kinase
LQESAKRKVIEVLEAQFTDNQKARLLKPDGTYERLSPGKSEPVRVQLHLYKLAMQEREQVHSAPPVRFVPIQAKE